jgi:L-amino acid N-acyltransferase YncA
MNINFQDLRDSDFTEVKRIYDWYIANSTATFHTEPIQISELKEFIYTNHPRYKSYLILLDNQIAGYCYFTYYKKRQAYDRTAEVTLYLDPEIRGKGIGKISLEFLEKKAVEVGLKNLLAIITGDNTGSIALFAKSGYTKCADFKNVGEKFGKVLDVVGYQKQL